ncbi:MAG: amidohydrolase family protein [Candidatus Micrarchaeia archaeon]
MTILIRNALLVTQNSQRSIFKSNLFIKGNRIAYIGSKSPSADVVMEGDGYAVLPGFINTHTHVAMSMFKGLLDDIDLELFLEKTFKLDSNRKENEIFDSALLGIKEMIDSGITSFLDLYYSEDTIARAAQQAGIRSFLSWVVLDKKYTTQHGNPIDNAKRFIKSFRGNNLVTPSVGIQGVYVASDATIAKAESLAKEYNTILHMHLAETRKEITDYSKKTGDTPVAHLYKHKMLNQRVVAAHCVWLSEDEIKMLAKSGISVSWNHISNAKLASGSAPISEMLESGVNISIGTDSNGSNNSLNMFEAMKFSALSLKDKTGDAAKISAQRVFDMATINGAKALHRKDLGSIELGKKADLVLLDIEKPNMTPSSELNIVNNIVYSANPSNVSHVIINGNIVK